MEYFVIGLIAFTTSVFAGMLGLGGAVLLIPAYLYLPPLFGVEPIGIKFIAGMTSLQVLSSSLSGMLFHQRKGSVNFEIVLKMGLPILFASFFGAALSSYLRPEVILAVFAIMTVIGAGLIIFRRNDDDLQEDNFRFNTSLGILIALSVGFFGGIAGAPGAFILAPLMINVLKVPVRITIGSTLGVVLISAASASTGKLITGQVPILLTSAAVIASLPGVFLGSIFSYRLNVSALRIILAILITAVGFEMWYQVFF